MLIIGLSARRLRSKAKSERGQGKAVGCGAESDDV